MYSSPIAYFLTFTTRGARLHGCEKGSVDRFGRSIDVDPQWEAIDRENMNYPPIVFTELQRQIVTDAIRKFCFKHFWKIHVLAVQTNHVHILVSVPDSDPESAATALKSAASRVLYKQNQFPKQIKIWTRLASTKYVFNDKEFQAVYGYIKNQ